MVIVVVFVPSLLRTYIVPEAFGSPVRRVKIIGVPLVMNVLVAVTPPSKVYDTLVELLGEYELPSNRVTVVELTKTPCVVSFCAASVRDRAEISAPYTSLPPALSADSRYIRSKAVAEIETMIPKINKTTIISIRVNPFILGF